MPTHLSPTSGQCGLALMGTGPDDRSLVFRALAGQHLWVQLAAVVASRPEQQPVQLDQIAAQRSGQPAAKHLVGGVGDALREEGHVAG